MTSRVTTTAGEPKLTIGLDIGASKIHGAAFGGDLEPIAEVRVTTNDAEFDVVIDTAIDAITHLVAQRPNESLAAIGIGIPGRVDPASGTVSHAVNLGVGAEPLPVAARIREHHDVPSFLENDVNAAAFGAYAIMRQSRNIDSLTFLSIGTGIAAGVILNGHIYRGGRGVAGEIGHFPVAHDGPACICGLRGCVESVASGRAIERAWKHCDTSAPAADLFAAAARGVAEACAIVDVLTLHLARAVYLLAVTYDTECTVIGGGVAGAGTPLLAAIVSGISRLEAASDFVASLDLVANLMLEPSPSVGAIGAAAVAARRLTEGRP